MQEEIDYVLKMAYPEKTYRGCCSLSEMSETSLTDGEKKAILQVAKLMKDKKKREMVKRYLKF